MRMWRTGLAMLLVPSLVHAQGTDKPIKVFILAGQSNMEGKAKTALMEYQSKQPGTAELYKHLRTGDKWTERPDVWIKFFDRKGKLTIGYGSPNCIGPELQFGWVVGDYFEEPVLLIKTAWGGRSVYQDFRSPSAGLPSNEVLEKMLADRKKRKAETTMDDVKKSFGASYRAMIDEVQSVTADIKKHFPDAGNRGYELAGLAWFQGWNDMINATATAEYTVNLSHFIRDVRKDLKSPNLPFVIGQMGVDGMNAGDNVKKFKDAQSAVLKEKGFEGNVALVRTDVYWDVDAEKVFKKGWRENLEEWNKVGSDYPFHYLGSPKTMLGIGRGLAESMIALQKDRPRK